jgi:ATP-dependent DNA helicase RecQ
MFDVDTSLQEALQKFFGFENFKGSQEKIIHHLLEGKDTFVIMPTGGGKSMCYQLPALISEGTAIIISPLIALMKNQVDSIRNFGTEDGIAHFLNSSLSKAEITKVKKDISSGKTKLLYVAPESLTKDENVQFLRDVKVSFYAVDEAHCISEWGHDFRPEYRRIRTIIDQIGKRPLIALTATATPKVQQDILKNLGISDVGIFKSSFNRPNLYYEVRAKSNVVKEIIKFIRLHPGKSGIIYCLSRKKVEEMASNLQANGIKALPYHAGLEASKRAENQDKFLMEEVDVIVATIAFGMGIDKPDVRYVIHHDIPKSLEGYYQETGRAGRDGGEGICVTFYSYEDIVKLEKFMKGKPVSEQEIGKQLLLETVAYAESSVCRRKSLLHYFGEEYTETSCGQCDNCLHPKQKYEAEESLELVLETIQAVKEKFKAKHVVNVICGTRTAQTKSYKHEDLDVFGRGVDETEKFWNSVIRQAIVHDFLSKDIENYGLLKLSKKGLDFLEKPYSIQFTKDLDFDTLGDDDDAQIAVGGQKSGALDETLLSMLKDLRKKLAKQKDQQPWVLFEDPSLEDMAIQYPVSMDELRQIQGVSQGKAARYGKDFVDLIRKYVEENEITRPMDMVVKSVANESSNKIYIIKNVDKRIALDDIASAKGLSMDDLITEIESILSSGTKVNINYYIDDVIDEEKQDEIYEYFREAETSSIDAALKELGEDEFTELEIRLMRVKFICEHGH